MRVLHVVQSYYPATVYGGPIFSVHYAAQAMARSGHDVRASTTNANRPGRLDVPLNRDVEFEPNYRVRYYHDTIIDRFSWGFSRAIGADIAACDIVHLQDVFSTYALITLREAVRQQKPLVISPRGVFSAWAMGARKSWVKRFWVDHLFAPLVKRHKALGWHATSDQEAADTKVWFPDADPFVVVNGIDLSAYVAVAALPREEWAARYWQAPLDPYATVFVTMGRLHEVKGLDIALEALAIRKAQGQDFVFLMAGRDEGAMAGLNDQARRLGVEGNIRFVGELLDEEKIRFLKGADIFLFPSRSENFGIACLEGLAAGLPVVASRETPWASLEERGAGLWIENSPAALATAMVTLSPEKAKTMHGNALALAGQYGFEAIALQFTEHYSSIITSSRAK